MVQTGYDCRDGDPENPEVLRARQAAEELLDQDRYEEAEISYLRIVKRFKKDGRSHLGLGTARYHLGKFRQAKSSLRNALRYAPELKSSETDAMVSASCVELARHSLELKRFEECERECEEVFALAQGRLRRTLIQAHLLFGRARYAQDKTGDAKEAFAEALRLDPRHAESHYCVGLAYERIGQHSRARTHYEKAVQRKPTYGEAYYRLGSVLLKLGSYVNGVSALKEALKAAPNLVEKDKSLEELRDAPAEETEGRRKNAEDTVSMAECLAMGLEALRSDLSDKLQSVVSSVVSTVAEAKRLLDSDDSAYACRLAAKVAQESLAKLETLLKAEMRPLLRSLRIIRHGKAPRLLLGFSTTTVLATLKNRDMTHRSRDLENGIRNVLRLCKRLGHSRDPAFSGEGSERRQATDALERFPKLVMNAKVLAPGSETAEAVRIFKWGRRLDGLTLLLVFVLLLWNLKGQTLYPTVDGSLKKARSTLFGIVRAAGSLGGSGKALPNPVSTYWEVIFNDTFESETGSDAWQVISGERAVRDGRLAIGSRALESAIVTRSLETPLEGTLAIGFDAYVRKNNTVFYCDIGPVSTSTRMYGLGLQRGERGKTRAFVLGNLDTLAVTNDIVLNQSLFRRSVYHVLFVCWEDNLVAYVNGQQVLRYHGQQLLSPDGYSSLHLGSHSEDRELRHETYFDNVVLYRTGVLSLASAGETGQGSEYRPDSRGEPPDATVYPGTGPSGEEDSGIEGQAAEPEEQTSEQTEEIVAPEEQPPAPVFTESRREVRVQSNRAEIPTGMDVKSGDILQFEARSAIELYDTNAGTGAVGPEGAASLASSHPNAAGFPLANSRCGCLIGKIGEGGTWFSIGQAREMVVSDSGEIYLGINDRSAGLNDNDGAFKVRITRRTPSLF